MIAEEWREKVYYLESKYKTVLIRILQCTYKHLNEMHWSAKWYTDCLLLTDFDQLSKSLKWYQLIIIVLTTRGPPPTTNELHIPEEKNVRKHFPTHCRWWEECRRFNELSEFIERFAQSWNMWIFFCRNLSWRLHCVPLHPTMLYGIYTVCWVSRL